MEDDACGRGTWESAERRAQSGIRFLKESELGVGELTNGAELEGGGAGGREEGG